MLAASCAHATTAIVIAFLMVLPATPASANTDLGYPGPEYDGATVEHRGGPVTGQKPESKLWYAEGAWWTVMPSAAKGGARTIHRLALSAWADTGVLVDERADTKEDVLFTGDHVYIVSRASRWSGHNQLRRFSFVDGTYALDSGFPSRVSGGGAEAVTIARDSTGTLWLAYERDSLVQVARSLGADHEWSEPVALPHEGARTVDKDDIASVVAFEDERGPAIGIMWSNQPEGRQYFSVHRDGDPPGEWSLEVALEGPNEADDHISLQTAEGRVYAAVKTSNDQKGETTARRDTRNGEASGRLLVRERDGTWSSHIVSLIQEHHTRPHLQIHLEKRLLYVFVTVHEGDATWIGYKVADLDDRFFPGRAIPLLRGERNIDNSTGAKQVSTAESGVLVLASDGERYVFGGVPDPASATACRRERARAVTVPQVLATGRWDAALCMAWWALAGPLYGDPARLDEAGLTRTVRAGLSWLDERLGLAPRLAG